MSGRNPSLPRAAAKFVLLVVILAALGGLAWRYNVPLESLREIVSRISPALRYPAFVALFALVSVAPVPARDVVKLTGAVLFGGFISGLLVFAGEMGATAVAWLLGRALGKDFVDRLLAGRLAGWQEKIRGATWWQIALLRIFPGTPYRFVNYAAPVTDVGAAVWFLGCAAGTLPRTMVFQLLFGSLGDSLTRRGTTTFQVFVVSIAFAVFVLGFFAWWSRRKAR